MAAVASGGGDIDEEGATHGFQDRSLLSSPGGSCRPAQRPCGSVSAVYIIYEAMVIFCLYRPTWWARSVQLLHCSSVADRAPSLPPESFVMVACKDEAASVAGGEAVSAKDSASMPIIGTTRGELPTLSDGQKGAAGLVWAAGAANRAPPSLRPKSSCAWARSAGSAQGMTGHMPVVTAQMWQSSAWGLGPPLSGSGFVNI